jgi:hypothetical protein
MKGVPAAMASQSTSSVVWGSPPRASVVYLGSAANTGVTGQVAVTGGT